jgi:hypothetical protein
MDRQQGTDTQPTMTRRRWVVACAGGAGIFGVGSFAALELTGDDGPAYNSGDESTLVPNSVGPNWPDQDLVRDDDWNNNYLRAYLDPDRVISILIDTDISETVAGAKSAFENSKLAASDPDKFNIGDQSFIVEGVDSASVIWRESNAIGEVAASRVTNNELQPDRARTTQYARLVYRNHW